MSKKLSTYRRVAVLRGEAVGTWNKTVTVKLPICDDPKTNCSDYPRGSVAPGLQWQLATSSLGSFPVLGDSIIIHTLRIAKYKDPLQEIL